MYPYSPITAVTCESLGRNDARRAILPSESQGFDLFSLHDPFGLRKAIVPVLLVDADGITRGMGTAFHVDGWGTFLTADHVVDAVRQGAKITPSKNEGVHCELHRSAPRPILLLGGLVYGQPIVPDEALARIAGIFALLQPREDPLAVFGGQKEYEAVFDIAVMRLAKPLSQTMTGTLASRFSGVPPKIGDEVVAVGFPDLDCKRLDNDAIQYLLSDGMSAAYGRIVDVHPKGVRNHRTPLIEVEANWPPGMSGGPVFNQHGEVIASVSFGWRDVGYAGCLSMMPWLRGWVPTIDAANPGWRRGWAVFGDDRNLIGFYRSKEDALQHQRLLGSDYTIGFGSNQIGTAVIMLY